MCCCKKNNMCCCKKNNVGLNVGFERNECCERINTCRERGCDFIDRKCFSCRPTHEIHKHQHVIKHRHDIINEYDVVHEHDYHYRNVVKQREVTKHHECEPYNPNYCPDNDCDFDDNDCGCL